MHSIPSIIKGELSLDIFGSEFNFFSSTNLPAIHQLTSLSLISLYTYLSIVYYTRLVNMEEDQCGPSCSIHDHANDSSEDMCECECECNNHHKKDECSCCDIDPVNAAKSLLESAFFVALKEIHVEKMKKLIEKEWGTTIDKAVVLTFKTMEKQWQSSITKATASKEFYTELEKILAASKEKSK